jgi:hypothetical protein
MYFPYLYGRRFDLLALREVLGEIDIGSLVPIIEPVCEDLADIKRCLSLYGNNDAPCIVVINPDKYQLATAKAAAAFRRGVKPLFEEYSSLVPGLYCSPNASIAQVQSFQKIYGGDELALIYSNAPFTDAEVKALAGDKRIAFHVVIQNRMSATQQNLLPKSKKIEIGDCFNKFPRNSDYGAAEFFTDRHKAIPAQCMGIGDYAALGPTFTPGGGTPSAVAIHATFKRPRDGNVWVEHFVSDDVDPNGGSVASKFLQAAKKLVDAANGRPGEFGSNFSLDYFQQQVADNYFPGLPKNKQQQIMHHICLMLAVIDGDL